MDREEKRRKFHQAVLNKLHPPTQQQQKDLKEKEEEKRQSVEVNLLRGSYDYGSLDDDSLLEEEKSSSSSDDKLTEHEPQKLTRAQRKRLRKKKLKEAASSRRKIIGPLLPSSDSGNGGHDSEDDTVNGLTGNDSMSEMTGSNAAIDNNPGEQPSCSTQKKLKIRRKAKSRRLDNNETNASVGGCHQADLSLTNQEAGEEQ